MIGMAVGADDSAISDAGEALAGAGIGSRTSEGEEETELASVGYAALVGPERSEEEVSAAPDRDSAPSKLDDRSTQQATPPAKPKSPLPPAAIAERESCHSAKRSRAAGDSPRSETPPTPSSASTPTTSSSSSASSLSSSAAAAAAVATTVTAAVSVAHASGALREDAPRERIETVAPACAKRLKPAEPAPSPLHMAVFELVPLANLPEDRALVLAAQSQMPSAVPVLVACMQQCAAAASPAERVGAAARAATRLASLRVEPRSDGGGGSVSGQEGAFLSSSDALRLIAAVAHLSADETRALASRTARLTRLVASGHSA
jgi:hypothetical protein